MHELNIDQCGWKVGGEPERWVGLDHTRPGEDISEALVPRAPESSHAWVNLIMFCCCLPQPVRELADSGLAPMSPFWQWCHPDMLRDPIAAATVTLPQDRETWSPGPVCCSISGLEELTEPRPGPRQVRRLVGIESGLSCEKAVPCLAGPFFNLFSKHLLSTYCVPDLLLGI